MISKMKKALVSGLLVLGTAQSAYSFDLVLLIPTLFNGGKPFEATLAFAKASYTANPLGIFILPFAFLSDTSGHVALDHKNLTESGYTEAEIATYSQDIEKIGAAIHGRRITPEQFKAIAQQLELSPVTKEILQLK